MTEEISFIFNKNKIPAEKVYKYLNFQSKKDNNLKIKEASTKRLVYDELLFDNLSLKLWEYAYDTIMNKKYKKNTRGYSKEIVGSFLVKEPPIFLIPRERGGPSYYDTKLSYKNYTSNELTSKTQYCAISKGFGMQDVSSFVMGPIIGHGLCLVNAAFSKSIYEFHIRGGVMNLNKKNFWELKNKHSVNIDKKGLKIDGKYIKNVELWLRENKNEWFEEWNKWRMAVALCSVGDFHWDKCGSVYSETLCYCDPSIDNNLRFMGFVEWKKNYYIKFAYDMLPNIEVYKHLKKLYDEGIPLGLVHPMVKSEKPEIPISKEYIRELYDSKTEMSCMPFVVAGFLLNVPIF